MTGKWWVQTSRREEMKGLSLDKVAKAKSRPRQQLHRHPLDRGAAARAAPPAARSPPRAAISFSLAWMDD